MERDEFEKLRDLPDKVIRGDIRFVQSRSTSPNLTADGIRIETPGGAPLVLNIGYNQVVGSKSFNVVYVGLGPICRLDVDGTAHRPAGRSHKHALSTPRCPDQNLRQVTDRPDLSGASLRAVFDAFCAMARIEHLGAFEEPDRPGGTR